MFAGRVVDDVARPCAVLRWYGQNQECAVGDDAGVLHGGLDVGHFAVYGYSLVFGDGGSLNAIIGNFDKLFLQGVTIHTVVGTIPEYLYFLFMLLFAAITPAIIVGAFAERMKFAAVMVFMAVWITINYIPMAHMAWGGGWVFSLGVQDFAGGNVVHLNVGIASLVGARLIGRRRGFGTSALAPHNMTMTMTGGSLLWVGWLGFCGGCVLAVNGFAMLVMVNTMLASCAGALGWMLVEWKHRGRPSLFGAVSGSIAGLVAITPACGFVGPMGAIVLGFIAGPLCLVGGKTQTDAGHGRRLRRIWRTRCRGHSGWAFDPGICHDSVGWSRIC